MPSKIIKYLDVWLCTVVTLNSIIAVEKKILGSFSMSYSKLQNFPRIWMIVLLNFTTKKHQMSRVAQEELLKLLRTILINHPLITTPNPLSWFFKNFSAAQLGTTYPKFVGLVPWQEHKNSLVNYLCYSSLMMLQILWKCGYNSHRICWSCILKVVLMIVVKINLRKLLKFHLQQLNQLFMG